MSIDLYSFVEELNRLSSPEDIICPSASGYGTLITLQTWKLKPGQRFTTNFVFGQMGAGLSTAIGATLATGKRVLLIEGDGGFQLNVQELAVVKRLQLPIIMFVVNNNGYHSIREMQKNRFDGRLVGCDDTSGVELPSIRDIAKTYYLNYCKLSTEGCYSTMEYEHTYAASLGDDYRNMIESLLKGNRPYLVEIEADPNQQYHHKLKSQLVDGKWQWQKLEEIE
jgi:thiamine pyrophosphate-dependent acetolactate synthase large subunit-like protein